MLVMNDQVMTWDLRWSHGAIFFFFRKFKIFPYLDALMRSLLRGQEEKHTPLWLGIVFMLIDR